MLLPFGEELWMANGPNISVFGFRYPTRTILIRLSDGALLVWSPIRMSPDLKACVDRLGPVRHIVAPNALHHVFVGEWQAAYPNAASYALTELRAKRADLRWDSDLGDTPPPAWSGQIDQVVMGGNRITTEMVFCHRRSRTVIFTDLIQHFAPVWFRGWRAIAAKLDGLTAPRPTVPRKFRIAFRNRDETRKAVERILAWPAAGVLRAHGAPITGGGRDAIAHAFGWLLHR